jgi:hypothetical protein
VKIGGEILAFLKQIVLFSLFHTNHFLNVVKMIKAVLKLNVFMSKQCTLAIMYELGQNNSLNERGMHAIKNLQYSIMKCLP